MLCRSEHRSKLLDICIQRSQLIVAFLLFPMDPQACSRYNSMVVGYHPYVWTVVRIVWLLIILASCSIFTYMIVTKITYLVSHPKNVDVSVDFKNTMQFPAVTICNQNPYRYMPCCCMRHIYPATYSKGGDCGFKLLTERSFQNKHYSLVLY